jgi:hypothetical protein
MIVQCVVRATQCLALPSSPIMIFNFQRARVSTFAIFLRVVRKCLRLSEFLMGSRQNFSDRFLILRSSTVFDEVAMEALKFGPSSQRPCLG